MFCPPKVGGSTLTGRLQHYDSRNNFFYQPRWNEDKFRIEELKHITYQEFLEYEDSKLLDDYYKFGFVRNIYDRIYSGFLMRCDHIKNVRHPRLIENKEYLNKLDNYLAKNSYSFNRSLPLLIEIEDMGFIPLSSYTHHKGNQVLDFIGYNERFEHDYETVCKNLNITDLSRDNRIIRTPPKPPSDPHKMLHSDYKYLEMYERKTIDLVNSVFAEDFDHYGYQILDPNDFPDKIENDISFDNMKIIGE